MNTVRISVSVTARALKGGDTNTSILAIPTTYLPLPTLLCLKALHPPQFCRLSSSSVRAFNTCPCIFSFPTFPRRSSQCVSALLAVSSTLGGLAEEKTQPAGGRPVLPECFATLQSRWHPASGSPLRLGVHISFRKNNDMV